jgi:putative Mn2+ efflux pump MntP
MAQLFWRTRLKRRARKIILSLPDLPADIDDNVFIALGTQAAEADKTSKAYDEFLFSEEGYEQMPYEDSVDEILTLQRTRTPERRGRAELPSKMIIESVEKRLEAAKRDVDDAESELAAITSQIQEEQKYLTGEKRGEENGFWEGVSPDTTSRRKHVSNVMKEWLVFVIVGLADAAIVVATLYAVLPTFNEAIMFSIPAIGVQILFPHLTGKAIAAYRSNKEGNAQEFYVALGVGVAWLLYVFGMTILRINLLTISYEEREKDEMPLLLWIATLIFTFLILIGLGVWVLVRSMRSNPHKDRVSRLLFVYFNKKRSFRAAEKELGRAQGELEKERKILATISDHWDLRAASYDQVSESAKAVYRRALVNQVGEPMFTTEYLPESKFKIKRSKKRNEF